MQRQDESPKRRLPGLADLMIVVASAALGMVLYRYSKWLSEDFNGQTVFDIGLYEKIKKVGEVYFIPLLTAATVGYALIRLRRPRPPWEQLVNLPGTVAVYSVILVLTWSYAWMCVHLIRGKAPAFIAYPMQFDNGVNPAWAVAGSWLTLLLAGRWRSDSSWVDRLGIGLGLSWLALLPLWYAIPLLAQ